MARSITAIDDGTETVTVALFAATSSAQRLGVNQASTLTGVAVEYMDCGYTIFEVGDRVCHDLYGLGVVTHLDSHAATVDFGEQSVRIKPPYAKLQHL